MRRFQTSILLYWLFAIWTTPLYQILCFRLHVLAVAIFCSDVVSQMRTELVHLKSARFTNPSYSSSLRTASANYYQDRIVWSNRVLFLVPFLILQFADHCGRLSWSPVNFSAHAKLFSNVSYRTVFELLCNVREVTKEQRFFFVTLRRCQTVVSARYSDATTRRDQFVRGRSAAVSRAWRQRVSCRVSHSTSASARQSSPGKYETAS